MEYLNELKEFTNEIPATIDMKKRKNNNTAFSFYEYSPLPKTLAMS